MKKSKADNFEQEILDSLNSETPEQIMEEIDALDNKNKKDKDTIFTSYLETDQYILEEVVSATHATRATRATEPQFLRFNKETEAIEAIDSFKDETLGKMTYKPINDDLMANKCIYLSSKVEEYGTTDKLVGEIREFFKEYFELPPFHERFLPYLVLFYWVFDRFPFVPYIHFVGRTSTGKTTAMEVLGSICYKAIDASGAISMASIFRTASNWRGTLLLDEFVPSGDSFNEMTSFLKSGVSNRAVLRVEGEREKSVKAYMIKCPKIFTSENPISDAGLQSRTIVVKMLKNKRQIPLYRLKRYDEKAQDLRNKLLLWRFRNINKIDLNTIEFGFEELKGFDRRVQQVITPIYYFSNEETKLEIAGFAEEQQQETTRERREAIDGQIFQLIAESFPFGPTIKLITTEVNKGKSSKFEYSEKKISNVIRKILGFDINRMGHENISTVIIDEDKFKELSEYYGIENEEKGVSVASVARVASVANDDPEQTEIEA